MNASGSLAPYVHPQAARALDSRGIQIEADHVAAGRAQQLRGDLADQAETEHRDALAELRRRAAHALQRNRADRGRRREAHGAAGGMRHTRLRFTTT